MANPNLSRVLQLAKEIAAQQGRLGDSPADTVAAGRLHLCAASCVAEAAIIVTGKSWSREEFRERIHQSDKFTFLPAVFADCGISPRVAIALIKENDSRAAEQRLDWFNDVAQLQEPVRNERHCSARVTSSALQSTP